MNLPRVLSLLLLMMLTVALAFGQQKTLVRLEQADKLKPAQYEGKVVQMLSGSVIFRHQSTQMYCDSAYFFDDENRLIAFGNIHINDRDSLHIFGKVLKYDGNTGIAEVLEDVKLQDRKMTLTTNHLIYNLKTRVGNYYSGGKIVDQENTLTSKVGYYYSRARTLFFQKNVKLVNPQYTMNSDTLIYNTATGTTQFHGPTTIVSKENSIYCEKGWYNTRTDISSYYQGTKLTNPSQSLIADSLYYDRKHRYGKAFRNIQMHDSTENISIFGNYGEYYETNGLSFFRDSAYAILVDEEQDSLFMHGELLKIYLDSNQKAQDFYATEKVLVFKSDLQAKCDTLHYDFADSTLFFKSRPIIWGSKSQMSGKKIRAQMKNGTLDVLFVDTNAFILQLDTMEYYNQVSGRNITAYFKEGTMDVALVNGNSQTIYFVKEEDGTLVGVNIANSSDLRVNFNQKGVESLTYLNKPKANLNPVDKLSKRALYLKGFKDYEYWRPKTRYEIFNWEPAKSELPSVGKG